MCIRDRQQGYDVIGVTMQIWQDEDTDVQEAEGGCCGLSAVDDARRVAMDLDVYKRQEEIRASLPSAWASATVGRRSTAMELVMADGNRIKGRAMLVSTP